MEHTVKPTAYAQLEQTSDRTSKFCAIAPTCATYNSSRLQFNQGTGSVGSINPATISVGYNNPPPLN